ncbi:hypothetical protein PanWU01x14_084080 [Parasponia andersonii]|uniref:Uncharacterized protein n=1 Tax=Parasponia andersonii TaxID=3476 RepID=A0A2P5D9I4_PARAD|nr:hypothetical protein PanWU01x14_084080 [Parasponia andersonii]
MKWNPFSFSIHFSLYYGLVNIKLVKYSENLEDKSILNQGM